MNEMNLNYQEIKNNIRTRFQNMQTDYVAIGYYLRQVLNNELYLEDGYKNIHEFAQAEFGMKKANVNHCIRINMEFSVGGDSPELDDKYRGFSKSQLQELLYIPEDRRDEVAPDMTVREIRELKEERLDVEPEPEKEPVSILGYPLRMYPEGSLLTTPGCGKYDCFSCHRGGCEIRQEECYCMEAPLGNKFPCATLNVVENLRADIGDQCQFVNEDLAFHRPGDGEPVPCCKRCNNPCGYECRRSVDKRHADTQDKESDKTKPDNHEKSSCPPDAHSCIRQEWGTDPEQQHEGEKECAKCWSGWKKRQEIVGAADKTVIKPDEAVIKQDDSVDIPEDNVIEADFPELEKSEDEQIPEPDESWNIGDLPKAPERYLKALARVLVEAKGIQMVISPAREKYLSDESIEKRIKELDKENGGCIHLGDSVLVYASQEIIEFYEGNTDLGVCSYKRFATQVRKAMDSWEPGQYAAENTENTEICCTNSSEPDEVTYSEIAIRDYLCEEERTLEEYERVNGVEKLPQNLMMRQKMIVKALKLLLESETKMDEEEPEDMEEDDVPEQPELPVMKNNDQRKEFLDSFHDWPVWFEVLETSDVYYRYNMPDGNSIVICEYNSYCEWMAQYNDMDPEKKYQKMYLLEPGYRYLHDCLKNKSQLVDYLKEAQKNDKR